MRNEQELENLLDLLYTFLKWHVYDEIAGSDISSDYRYDIIRALYNVDEARFEKAKALAIAEALQDGLEPERITAAGYELPEETK